jgi:hypothetical protein
MLLLFAVLLPAARLFTGIVYEFDDPTTYLVLKHRPSLAVVQENAADTPMRQRFTIIDGGENELGYQSGYTFLMRWAFGIAVACAGAGFLLRQGKA